MSEQNKLSLYRKLASKQVKKTLSSRDDIIAAYSDGSVGRGDLFPGSDIDIAFIVENQDEPWQVHRVVNQEHDVLIEWAFISKEKYTDIDQILEDAGFTHDIKDAYIYYDPNEFFKEVKEKILDRYKDKDRIKRAAKNQLEAIEEQLNRVEEALEEKDREKINDSLVNFIKFAAGFPRAVLNKPLTNSRALIWCRESCEELNLEEYHEHVLELLGVSNLSKEDAEKFLSLAKEAVSKLKNENKKEKLLHHLKAPEYLIQSSKWRASLFKTLLWASVPVKESHDKKENKETIIRLWEEMLSMIGWNQWGDIEKKVLTGEELLELGFELLEEKF